MNSRFPIVETTRALVKKSNAIDAEIIRNLQIILDQNIYLKMSYPSLFAFCTKELGMSESTAQRRIDMVRLSKAEPELPNKIANGEISLVRASAVAKFVRTEKKETGRSISKTEIQNLLNLVQAQPNQVQSEKVLSEQSHAEKKPIEDKRRFASGGRRIVEFEIDDETAELLEKYKNQTSHTGPKKMGEILKALLQDRLKQKTQRATKSLSRGTTHRGTPEPSRYIPAAIKQEVRTRDKGQCTYIDPHTGRQCESRHLLQFDHLLPFSHGGAHTVQNLTLRCVGHNHLNAVKWGLDRIPKS